MYGSAVSSISDVSICKVCKDMHIASFGWDVKPRSGLCSTPNMDGKDPDSTEEENLCLPAHTDYIHLQVWALHVSCRVSRRGFTPEVPKRDNK